MPILAAGASEERSTAVLDLASVAEPVSHVIEACGIAVIILGAVLATYLFLHALYARKAFGEAYHRFRANLGRGILLGLEFLVAADIIGTVAVDPTFQNLGVLGLIVLIRTFLSFTLEVEINGRWPWQGNKRGEQKS